MTDKLMDCIANPVKCKLLLEIHSQGKTTAKHLADIYHDIPQATLYRHLKKMLSDGILQVTEETQVRGTAEKSMSVMNLSVSGRRGRIDISDICRMSRNFITI